MSTSTPGLREKNGSPAKETKQYSLSNQEKVDK
jgi:hypothetical protein